MPNFLLPFFLLLALSLSGLSLAVQPNPAPVIRYDSIHHPVIGRNGMVATQHGLASEVGASILEQGGNAVDAAVAVGFSLAVVLPRAGNLGGGGFMLLHLSKNNQTLALDYREMAPAAAHRDMYLDSEGNVDKRKSRFSHAAAGVPGTVAGLLHAHKKFGKLPLEQVIQPAIDLAEQGFPVSHDLADKLARYQHLKKNPATLSAYYKPDGSSYQAGELLSQPDLAWSLRQIKQQGKKAFYQGEIAKRLVAEMNKHQGLITLSDLANYKVVERTPVRGQYRGHEIISMPPPSSGGVHIIQMLNTLEPFPLKQWGYANSSSIHHMTESMKQAYADRSLYLGDPDYVSVPISALTSKAYGQHLSKGIKPDQAQPSSAIRPGLKIPEESRDTTHYSIIDAEGNAVANTYTLNFSFGSGITVPGTGILLNNEMDDFAAKPGVPNAFGLLGGEANKIEPGKRPLSSMTPTFVFRHGQPWLVTGSPGGSRIITTTLQVIINLIDHGMNLAEAVHAPRFHHQWQPDTLMLEPGFSQDTLQALQAKGQITKQVNTMGSAQSVLWDGQRFFGAADPRRPDAKAIPVN